MFERFTDQARRTVVLAQEESRLFNHNYISTEHILLGLTRVDTTSEVLNPLGIDTEYMRAWVTEYVGSGGQSQSGHIPFTPSAKKILEFALREALQCGNNYTAPMHILLGILRVARDDTYSTARKILAEKNVDIDALHTQLQDKMKGERTSKQHAQRPRQLELIILPPKLCTATLRKYNHFIAQYGLPNKSEVDIFFNQVRERKQGKVKTDNQTVLEVVNWLHGLSLIVILGKDHVFRQLQRELLRVLSELD